MKNIALIIGSMMAGGIIAVGGYAYFAAAHPSANTPPVKIGRASCRERVCQYV